MSRLEYEFVVAGTLGPATRSMLADLDLVEEPLQRLVVELPAAEEAAALVSRLEEAGFEVVEVREVTNVSTVDP